MSLYIPRGLKSKAVASIPKGFVGMLVDTITNEIVLFDSNGIIASGSSGGTDVISTKLSLTSVEVLALNTTPIEIVAAPGVGKVILPFSSMLRVIFNTTPYSNGPVLILKNTGADDPIVSFGLGLEANNNRIIIGLPSGGSSTDSQIIENTALIATAFGGNPTLGDSPVDVYLTYVIITL